MTEEGIKLNSGNISGIVAGITESYLSFDLESW